MEKRSIKLWLAFILVVSRFTLTPVEKVEEAQACYPAYKCMSESSWPTTYKLYYIN
ncbi:hypothetical protein ACFFH4_20755 [Halalkalibacter alkalisediminis]|uniref:Uncharacterized protein n=1 Tax=Halalkalibacter alkalisediminis TaxID=935616 RepID=A0ABV6NKT8_9BACI